MNNNVSTINVNGWEINYTFTPAKKATQSSPVLLIGGAFQNFHSFKKDIVALRKNNDVYVVELPGQGCNRQHASKLDFNDLADLLKVFCLRLNLSKVIPIAFSYGSAIGYIFAALNPHLVEKLILAGTTSNLREEVKALLKESITELSNGNLEDFSKGVVINLTNYPKRKNIKTASFIVKAMYKNMKSLSENAQQRYIQNTQRLLNMKELPERAPICDTLILAGEYDNFTTPEECLEVAQRCRRACFGIIRDTDHLAPYQKRNVVNDVFAKFISNQPISNNKDVSFYDDLNQVKIKKEIFNTRSTAFITINDCESEVPLLALDHYGCHIDLNAIQEKLVDGVKALIQLPDLNFQMETFLFENSKDPVKNCFFKLHDFGRFKALEKLIKKKHKAFEYIL